MGGLQRAAKCLSGCRKLIYAYKSYDRRWDEALDESSLISKRQGFREQRLKRSKLAFLDQFSSIRVEASLMNMCRLPCLLIKKIEAEIGGVGWRVEMQ